MRPDVTGSRRLSADGCRLCCRGRRRGGYGNQPGSAFYVPQRHLTQEELDKLAQAHPSMSAEEERHREMTKLLRDLRGGMGAVVLLLLALVLRAFGVL